MLKKSDMIDIISEKSCMNKTRARAAHDALIEAMKTELKKPGGSVVFTDIGRLNATVRSARTARNPKTGEEIKVPPISGPSAELAWLGL